MSVDYHQRLSRYAGQGWHRWYLSRAYAAGVAQLRALGRQPLAAGAPRVLLCGTGAAATTQAFSKFVHRENPAASIVAMDLSLTPLRESSGALVQFLQADARALPFADGSVHLIESDFLLQFLTAEDRAAVLREWRRVLHPTLGGLMTRDYFPGGGGLERWIDAGRQALLRWTLGVPLHPSSEQELETSASGAELVLNVDRVRVPFSGLRLPVIKLVAAIPG